MIYGNPPAGFRTVLFTSKNTPPQLSPIWIYAIFFCHMYRNHARLSYAQADLWYLHLPTNICSLTYLCGLYLSFTNAFPLTKTYSPSPTSPMITYHPPSKSAPHACSCTKSILKLRTTPSSEIWPAYNEISIGWWPHNLSNTQVEEERLIFSAFQTHF